MASTVRPLRTDDDLPVGLVLSGGGARGVFHVGVWEVLRDQPNGLRALPDVVSGTSAGAINGALIAAGLSPRDMLEFWLELGRRPPIVANDDLFHSIQENLGQLVYREPRRSLDLRRRAIRTLGRLLRKHRLLSSSGFLALLVEFVLTARFDDVSRVLDGVTTSYLFSTAPFRERLVEALGGEAIREPRVHLAINAVDACSGKVVRFVNHRPTLRADADTTRYQYARAITVDMILASASIPLLFNSVRLDGARLWDGGLLVNTPLAPTVTLGARRVIPVLVNAGGVGCPLGTMTLGAGFERLADAFLENAYNTDRELLLARNRLAKCLPERGLAEVELYEAIRPTPDHTFNAGSYLFFEPNALMKMYEAGRAAAHRWLERGPCLDLPPGT